MRFLEGFFTKIVGAPTPEAIRLVGLIQAASVQAPPPAQQFPAPAPAAAFAAPEPAVASPGVAGPSTALCAFPKRGGAAVTQRIDSDDDDDASLGAGLLAMDALATQSAQERDSQLSQAIVTERTAADKRNAAELAALEADLSASPPRALKKPCPKPCPQQLLTEQPALGF